ncbi:MAG: PQQ-dependent sugar dehydrogenase [Bdellovibrio sp.]|nr:PQQ-dependent sugar dehydrogenase [Bdellovibrio sp.]
MIKLFLATVAFCRLSAQAEEAKVYSSESQNFKYELLNKQTDVVWGFDFLTEDKIIFTTRNGLIKIFDLKTKEIAEVSGAPAVHTGGQSGLWDIRVYPKQKSRIYLTYSEPIGKNSAAAMGYGTLENNKLIDFKKIISALPLDDGHINFGSRIEFDNRGSVFVTVGDRDQRKPPQDLKNHLGKVLRFAADGGIPADNPFYNKKNALPEIWSYGHRDPQGIVMNPETGDLWLSEMGPKGGDELNHMKPGNNYGWPVISYGVEYSGAKVGQGNKTKAGMQQPVTYWVPSISPSGTTIYNGDQFAKWKGNIFMGTLSGMHLRRLVLDGHKVIKQEELLKDLELRFRNVRTGPDGFLYFSTDDGQIARLVPVTVSHLPEKK